MLFRALILATLALPIVSCDSTRVINAAPAKISADLLVDPKGAAAAPGTRTQTEQVALVNKQRLEACVMQVQAIRRDLEIRDQIQYGTEPAASGVK